MTLIAPLLRKPRDRFGVPGFCSGADPERGFPRRPCCGATTACNGDLWIRDLLTPARCNARHSNPPQNSVSSSFFATIKDRKINIHIPRETHRLLFRVCLAVSSLTFKLYALPIELVI